MSCLRNLFLPPRSKLSDPPGARRMTFRLLGLFDTGDPAAQAAGAGRSADGITYHRAVVDFPQDAGIGAQRRP